MWAYEEGEFNQVLPSGASLSIRPEGLGFALYVVRKTRPPLRIGRYAGVDEAQTEAEVITLQLLALRGATACVA